MKKQLFTLALLTLGYVASSQSMAVAVMAHMNKINETMAVGTTQMVNAVRAYVVSEKPKVAGPVLRIEEIVSGKNKGKWIITTENPGTAAIVIEKKLSGFNPKTRTHKAEHDITVTGATTKNKTRVTDRDGLVVESVQSEIEYNAEGIMVDEIDMDSAMEINAENEVNDDVMNDVE